MKVYVLVVESIDMPEFEFDILGIFTYKEAARLKLHEELNDRFCEGFGENYNKNDEEVSLSSGSLDVVYYIKEMEVI